MNILMAFNLAGSMKGALFILLPLIGSVILAYGVFQVAIDLRSNTRKRVIGRLKGRGDSRQKGEDAPESFRKQAITATGLLARAFEKQKFTKKFQRALDQADVAWSAAQTLVNLSALA